MKNTNKVHSYEQLLDSYNKSENRKCEAVKQQIREAVFYGDNLITY